MREFKSANHFTVHGRQVVTVFLDREEEREGLLKRLQSEGVTIDGVEVQIDGVESYAVTPLRKGMEIGLRLAQSENGNG